MPSLLNQSVSLIAFIRAVEAGSFTAAARVAGTTPSAISKSIQRLETELGTKLFRRSTRTFNLTSDGQAFFDRIAPLVRGIEDSVDAIRPGGGARGRLRVSMPSELGRLLMKSITSGFLAANPALELELALADRHVDVIREGYDVVFRVGAAVESDLRLRTLARLDMALVASPAFLRTWGTPGTIDEVQQLPFVRYLLGGRPLPVTFKDGRTILPKGRISLDAGFGLRAAAFEGMGVAHLMKCTVQADLDSGNLVQVLPQQSLPSMPLHALHAFGRLTPARVKLFSDFVAGELGQLAPRPNVNRRPA
ncbi:LysR family transcriptional regulator [Frateuria hangzhouensis]|uniref:LysR family transcriptional regulator n=1 Tax=Frateuria hangzhouensis TaxID=2995589 RepID=UPI0022609986|nr:LysR family transcriptional regulator [Frateuria sp. STR12]MCX7512251.1 LysR family transcriptional regulator [Frateuria sp. STR12]